MIRIKRATEPPIAAGAGWRWLALAGAGWRWLALAGAGWRWLALAGAGWRWLALKRLADESLRLIQISFGQSLSYCNHFFNG